MRLVHARQFEAVHKANVRASAGPLVVWATPNDVGYTRLGLSISRRVGSAAVRNRIKRLLRETFRKLQHDLCTSGDGYDLVISVRRHDPLTLNRYEQHLYEAARALERKWSAKRKPTPRNE
jgi:ribonuclease P protein component